MTGPTPEQIKKKHKLSLLINEWDNLMTKHFFVDIDEAIKNKTKIPDPEEMLLKRKKLEEEILKFN